MSLSFLKRITVVGAVLCLTWLSVNYTVVMGQAMARSMDTDQPGLRDKAQTTTTQTLSFSDQTLAAGLTFTHSTPITSGDGAQMISGAAAGDFNNDGWVDIFVIGGGLRADALFINNGDGTFIDKAQDAGIADPHLGSGAAVGDYNADGWLDIYVTSFGSPTAMGPGYHRLYRNNGDLTFTNVASAAGVNQASPMLADGMGPAFGDYDLDGNLDLFVAGWRKPGGEPALGNRLFHSNGDGTFSDVTTSAGIVDDGIRGFSPCFVDMNGDRYPELVLAADFGTSRYFVNNKDGTFTDHTHASGTDQTWSGMGSAVGDVNNDGLLDWYVTAIYDDDASGRGDGSKLYVNQGNHEFTEMAQALGVDDGGWGWGTVLVDFNHDGRLDIAAVNGWDLDAYKDERAKLWLQNNSGAFSETAQASGILYERNELGLLNLDYDNDGDEDLLITAYNGPLLLYRNDLSGSATNWLRLELDTQDDPTLAPNGFGSRVQIRANGQTYTRFLDACSHYLTQSQPSIHFGLGDAEVIDELRVEWPDGTTTTLVDVAPNQTLIVMPKKHQVYLPLVASSP